MKKVWILIAVAAMTLCMTSCGNNNHYTGSTTVENNTYENGDTWNEDTYEDDYDEDWDTPACEDDDEHYWEEGGAPVDEDDDWDDDDYGYGCGYDDNDDWYEDDDDDWYEDDDDCNYDEDFYETEGEDDWWAPACEGKAFKDWKELDDYESKHDMYDIDEEFVEECLVAYEDTDMDYLYDASYEKINVGYNITDECYGPDVVYCRLSCSSIWVCFEVDESCNYDIEEASVIGIFKEC